MIAYFILFVVIGGLSIIAEDKAVLIIIGIAVLWGLTHAPIWGLVSLGEMMLGNVLAGYIKKENNGKQK